jgi:diadenosine tetraphosphatase ApaH/serine/threonine PP2A family protein phosphatase
VTKHFGSEILDEFNAFFAKLPLVHFVDSVHKSIFCVHGGIPVNKEDPNKILAFRRLTFRSFKENIADMDTTAQQFLYNNPGLELARGKLVQEIPNTPGFEFGKRIFSDFMRKNKVDLFVRANQIIPEGYGLYWNNKLLSLCSTSEFEKKPIPAKIVEILFPADPEEGAEIEDGAEGAEESEEEESAEGAEVAEGEAPVDVDEVVDEYAESEEMEIGQGEAPPVEEIKETAIRLLDVENLHS